MRTSKTLSISLPSAQLKEAEKLAKKEHRTLSELFREALRRYQDRDETKPASLAAALQLLREDAKRIGNNRLSMREINAEIAAYRCEQHAKNMTQTSGPQNRNR